MFSHSELLQLANAKTIDERSKETNKKYFEKSFIFNNELTSDTSINYLNIYPDSREQKIKTILCNHRGIIKVGKNFTSSNFY
jgi:hypothetical protein